MDLKEALIESSGTRAKRNWRGVGLSMGLHALLVGGILFASMTATHKVAADESAMPAFLQHVAPPPPPPAAAAPAPSSSAPKPVVKPTVQPVRQPTFVQPREIPKEVPKVQPVRSTKVAPQEVPEPEANLPTESQGVTGGVAGGVQGGVVGGDVGGVVGGEIGGVAGGELGGVKGGVVGGVLGGTVGAPPPPPPPPEPPKVEEPPKGPLKVGGDVSAPKVLQRVEPDYTESARRANLTGVVVLEAVINKNGGVERIKVVKGLPMGLDEAAKEAVRQWKFSPGMKNGEPVEVIFNLTVNFQLGDK